jgi:hypothetical protein
MQELFRMHDLNGNGTLEEEELIQLNLKIKMLHHGVDIDRSAVEHEFRSLFRSNLDPEGRPVSYETFRRYMFEVLDQLDPQLEGQEMILEQLGIEAKNARQIAGIDSASTPEGSLCPLMYEQVTLEHAEGHPAVHIFAEPRPGAAVVGEVPSGTSACCLGWDGPQGEFIQVCYDDRPTWTKRENVIECRKRARRRRTTCC